MSQTAFAALVDWGTSNFRLWLVDGTGTVLAERQSAEGMGSLEPDQFAGVLEGHLAALGAAPDLPVVAAGMVGARTGWVEAPYATAPTSLEDLFSKSVKPAETMRRVHILPGVCQTANSAFDVMRGEETQLAGALKQGIASGLFCLPGTHSKWAWLENGQIMRFKTVMTGELFSLISRQSILRLTIRETDDVEEHLDTFEGSVREALTPDFALTSRLFSIRAESLLSKTAPSNAAARLSGLLIGAEVASIKEDLRGEGKVYLIGSGILTRLYARAISVANAEPVILDGDALVRQGLYVAAQSLFPEQSRI